MRYLNLVADWCFDLIRQRSLVLSILIGVLGPWNRTHLLPAEYFMIPLGAVMLLHRIFGGQWTFSMHASRTFSRLSIAVLLSCLGYAAADLVRGTGMGDILKGQLRLVVLYLDLLVILALIECSWRNFFVILVTFSVFECLHVVVDGPESGNRDEFSSLWRYGFALPITYIVGGVVGFTKKPIAVLMMLILAVIHLSMENRSFAGMCVFGAVFMYAPAMAARWKTFSKVFIVGVALALLGGGYVFFNIKESSRSEGSNTNRAAMMLAAWDVFMDNPVIGQGSTTVYFQQGNPSFTKYYYLHHSQITGDIRGLYKETDETILHSQVLTGLASGGILGGIFFILVLGMVGRCLLFSMNNEFPYRLLLMLVLFRSGFELIAGPFSTAARFELPIVIAPIVALAMLGRAARQGESAA